MRSALPRRTAPARIPWRRATPPNSTAISTRCGRSSRSMSKVESMAVAAPSTQYLAWLQRQRRGHLFVRAAQVAILVHTWATVLATVLGFTGAMMLGIAVAAALWWSNTLYKVLDPYLVVANAMPKTAFVP